MAKCILKNIGNVYKKKKKKILLFTATKKMTPKIW